MTVAAGTKIGVYEVLALVGAGGMGEVYRARDSKLKRDVALKILPDQFAHDTDRLARFQREAEVLASINHPGIAGIYGFEEYSGTQALVLELVEGETLEEVIRRGPVALDEALTIARQIAESLEAAHEKGVIHRDLKPANVKVTTEGRVKVLDFGLAKVFEAGDAGDMSKSPTLMSRSAPGMIIGTPSYLSPEQARGKPVDKRADIWAFGCVLYEMLTGKQAFAGETMSDVMASILARDANWEALPASIGAPVRDLIMRCLQKDPVRRLRDIGDARIEIESLIAKGSASPIPTSITSELPRRFPTALVLTALLVVLAAVNVGLVLTRQPPNLTWSGSMLGGPGAALGPRISPDGHLVAFMAWVDKTNQVAVMNPESGDWTILTHDKTHGYLSNVCWSSDGTKIYYGRIDGVPRGIFSVPALGGEERLVLENAKAPEALPDGSLLFIRTNENRRSQIYRLWPETGKIDALPAFPTASDFAAARGFHDGKAAAFLGRSAEQAPEDSSYYIYEIDLESKQTRRIVLDRSLPAELTTSTIAISSDDKFILAEAQNGDLFDIVKIPRAGGSAEIVISTTNPFNYIDAAHDGSIVVDQVSRPFGVLALTRSDTTPQTVFSTTLPVPDAPIVTLPDGRMIVQGNRNGRSHLGIAKPGESAFPFLQTTEETAVPAAPLRDDQFTFIIGSGMTRRIAVASVNDGRIIRRLEKIDGAGVNFLASSPDGRTIYYQSGKNIWSVPSADGEPHLIRPGDSMAVDPGGKYLIVQLTEKETVRFVRVPLDGGAETQLSFPEVHLANSITGNAIRSDGAIIATLAFGDFNWGLGLLHPDTGKMDRIAVDPSFDVHWPTFLPDGSIRVAGFGFNATMWRFRPTDFNGSSHK